MKSDIKLKKDVVTELVWDPTINAAGIVVEAVDRMTTVD